MPTNVELYHYGIKGMRWGHRKARPQLSGAQRSARRKKILKRVAIGAGAAAGAAALGYGAYRGHKALSTPSGAAKLMIGAMRVDQGIDRAKSGARTLGTGVKGMHTAVKKVGKESIRKRVESIHDYTSPQAIARREVARSNKRIARSIGMGKYANLAGQASVLGVRGSAREVGKAAKLYGKAMGATTAFGAQYATKSAKRRAGAAASKAGQKMRQARAAAEMAADIYRTRRKYSGKHAAHFAYDTPGEALYHFALDPYGRYAIL